MQTSPYFCCFLTHIGWGTKWIDNHKDGFIGHLFKNSSTVNPILGHHLFSLKYLSVPLRDYHHSIAICHG